MKSLPNILWIYTDQQRYDTLRATGNEEISTPSIDKLARTGVAFTHAYCQSPICTPSRGSFLTGMYPSTVHACLNGNDHWSAAAPLVTELLRARQYECGLVGKHHLAGQDGRREPGIDDAYDWVRWSPMPVDLWTHGHDYADWVKSKGSDLSQLTSPPEGDNYGWSVIPGIPASLHQTTWCAEMAEEFIRKRAQSSRPWMLSVNPFDPHPPFDPPDEYLRRCVNRNISPPLFRESDMENHATLSNVDFQTSPQHPSEGDAIRVKAAYYAMIELLDMMVGRLLEALEDSDQRNNTIVIFGSDHGEMLGDHGLMLKGCRFYEGLIRVPLVISWPARAKQGGHDDSLVELVDIVPTLLEAAGIEVPTRMQGKSLLRRLTGDTHRTEKHRDYVRCEYYRALNAAWRPHFEGSYGTMIRNDRFKLSVYHGHEFGELYDLHNDPCEFENLWASRQHRDVKLHLMKENFDRLALAVDTGPEQTVRW